MDSGTSHRTPNLDEAAYQLSQTDVRFVGLERRSERSFFFIFEPKERCEQHKLDFISGKAMCRARDFADALRRCKDLVYSAERPHFPSQRGGKAV
jgi:hypothetical protein